MRTAAAIALVLSAVVAAPNGAPQSPGATPARLDATLAQVSRQVEAYYSHARSILCTERVVMQPLGYDLVPDGFARQLVYELRIEWEPSEVPGALRVPGAPREPGSPAEGDARIARRLVSVNGRPPRQEDESRCMDPRAVSQEPLSVFLPTRRGQYAFSQAGAARTDGRAAFLLDYRDSSGRKPDVQWRDDCVSFDVPEKTRGRAWIDAETGDVLRLDERLVGQFDIPVPRAKQQTGVSSSMTIERVDTSIRYRKVTFSEPDETLLLPSSIETLSIARNAGTPRLRMTQTFSDYKRFVTNSRIVQ